LSCSSNAYVTKAAVGSGKYVLRAPTGVRQYTQTSDSLRGKHSRSTTPKTPCRSNCIQQYKNHQSASINDKEQLMAVITTLIPGTPAEWAVLAALVVVSPLLYYGVIWFVDPLSLRRFPGPSAAKVTPYWLFWQARHVRRFVKVHEAHKVLQPKSIELTNSTDIWQICSNCSRSYQHQ
jgi:hypothetical protein